MHTGCSSTQFLCATGQCVTACNGHLECADGSDEISCSRLPCACMYALSHASSLCYTSYKVTDTDTNLPLLIYTVNVVYIYNLQLYECLQYDFNIHRLL